MRAPPADPTLTLALDGLVHTLAAARRLVVLTGAGCSTESGIPDYRSPRDTPRREPMRFIQFRDSAAARQRYWSRAMVGWPRMASARPNPAHAALAALEAQGQLHTLITQNVDGLHQAAGSRRVIELHGALAEVLCLGCSAVSPRADLQARLVALNPGWAARAQGAHAPDGDADVEGDTATFRVPGCAACGGILKPRVVFFGERVPPPRVEAAFAAVDQADALLVAGSSLTVWSGLRFVRRAHERGLPIAIATLGETRGDPLATVKVEGRLGALLPDLVARLGA